MTLPLEALALVVPAIASVVAGVFLLTLPRTRASGLFLGLAGLALLAVVVFIAGGSDAGARLSLTLGAAFLFPLALITYPRAAWRQPVDFVLTVLAGVCQGSSADLWTTSAKCRCLWMKV